MLEPQDRRDLIGSLQPPEGYALDFALGTTFSLDLLALLTAPLAFTFFPREHDEGQPTFDPVVLLETMRRYAARIALFCQAGQIAVPKKAQLLYSYLEDSVFEVCAPSERGVFHPKVWVLRFSSPGAAALYRVLCLSRNLTFDRSWDTSLVLEGELVDRKKGFSVSRPLAEFVAALPELALRALPERVAQMVDVMRHELRRVRFTPPEGFDEIHFWPLGIQGASRWPFKGRTDRLMVVSPFVSHGCLERLTRNAKRNILVSRLESLETLKPQALKNFAQICVLDSAAATEGTSDDVTDEDESLVGLHAKVYVADVGWDASVWTGSANATDAAYKGNVEFLVQLAGPKSRCGIDAIMRQEKGQTSFADLLQEFVPADEMPPADPDQQKLEETVEEVRRTLARVRWTARVTQEPGEDLYRVALHVPKDAVLRLPGQVAVRCWPITLKQEAAAAIGGPGEVVARFGHLSFEALTAFFGFEVSASEGTKSASCRFVVTAALDGAPSDRRERILRCLLRSRKDVLRFLMLLLSDEEGDLQVSPPGGPAGFPPSGPASTWHGEFPLLECLVRALYRDPSKLDRVARLVEDLRKTAEGKELLPPQFHDVWEPIWCARQALEH